MDGLSCLNVDQTAGVLGVSSRTLREAIQRGEFPPARRIGRRIVVPVRSLEAWMDGEDSHDNVVPLSAPT